jgi:type I restriction enzyme S subunit
MTDVNKLITDNIDVWTSAIKKRNAVGRGSSNKIELTGIKKLRELILELAVRGKLGTQNVNDEPASILLEKIAEEKTQLIAQKKFKKQIALPVIAAEEKTTELPIGWEWARLQSIIQISSGNGLTSKQMNMEGKVPVYGGNGVTGYHDAHNVDKRTLVIGRVGFYCGSVHITPERAWITDNAFVTTFSEENIYIDYLSWLLKATNLNENDSATAQPVISGRKLYPIVVCLPPLAEQHRIVAKVDELMALCDQLEQQTEESLSAHQTLVEVLLAALTKSDSAEDFQTSWQRIADHFDVLFTTEHSIEQLKQTVLQLAVMGRLVPQNPSDEPASVLLEKIAEEKAQLIADKKIKKQKLLPAITDEEKPFELPNSWEYERIGTFGIVGTGSTPSRSNPDYWQPAEYNWVSSGETSAFFLNETKEKVSALAIKETNVSLYPAGTLIVAMYGQGKTRGQITELLSEAGTNQACAAIRLVNDSLHHKDYVKLYFRKAYAELRSHAAGGAQPNLNVGKISNTVLALPPLAEQQRIVAKVDELMALCDQLKARLSDAQTTQLHLADAVVENALT